jgi:hypothetical protein
VLRFQQESGSAGEEFRTVTLTASFAEGVGLSGRTWRARDLPFVRDIGEMTDCVRARPTPASCWTPCPGCARPPTTPAGSR